MFWLSFELSCTELPITYFIYRPKFRRCGRMALQCCICLFLTTTQAYKSKHKRNNKEKIVLYEFKRLKFSYFLCFLVCLCFPAWSYAYPYAYVGACTVFYIARLTSFVCVFLCLPFASQ